MKTIDVGKQFYPRLANRDQNQGDGTMNAVEFRKRFLLDLDNEEAWRTEEPHVLFDFINVEKIGPSFANEAFAYFTKYTNPERVRKVILFENESNVQRSIIDTELSAGYTKWRIKKG